ncbi:ABC transporter ATP-binding protein [Allosediminivita pacifica]|uniref:Amino acid/amide ABC transporter ATP-binding protein 1 (HAAT family) n=1 Tax=Allosediminivita pacifica TaxID=1267769 RepID=A0A2T6A1F9_9RHOB|nr:ABC transporter ATP-binding protein [Allosediminivita pacifica]PTX37633.1 amino acid/amide ABC transporter ATP-binding protein 1 (HAAT family) [Allosediminivita pacifica]GGB09201.1 ABC transporter ATP-binding protein [Allosediminivita pacifica]
MPEPILSARGITKSFGALKASDDITLDLRAGEIHAVIGPNGAGKSTLIAQLCGGLAPDAGTVQFLGHDVTREGTAARARRGLARTFQISALAMEHSVIQNATLGCVGATGTPWRIVSRALRRGPLRDRAEQALARVGLQDHAATRVADLSHGQRRQLEVAVALTLQPKAFVMDEPMAGLGAEGSAQMTRLLHDLRHEAPILLVEHDMDAVFALADRISVLVYGQVIATGTVDEIRAHPEVRAAYLGDET